MPTAKTLLAVTLGASLYVKTPQGWRFQSRVHVPATEGRKE
jgi:hypothetical protein